MSEELPPQGDGGALLPPPPERSQAVDIEEEMKRSYLDYAMSVIIGRALPDVRDGLKPVHRRVLFGMWEGGNRAGRAYKKSARIVGDVMGKYHPHGDNAIYDTVARMAQDFSLRYLLVDGQGNFGSIDGDNPAAMRYTEVRLTRLAEEMLRDDIDKETVDWQPNYDGSEIEPMVLPARFPNLLVNGSSGIAVGMATNIPPHNLAEVIEALLLVIDDPEISILELMKVLPGPDFPTAATIHGRSGIREAYLTGRGSIQVRARAEIEDLTKDRQAIIVREIPYQVNKKRLIERIVELVREKKIEGISDLRDESDRRGIRLVIELKRGEIAEVLLNTLYNQTQLQVTFGINTLAIVDNRPQVLNLKQLLVYFLDHRKTVVIRRVRFDLRKAEARAHILEGLLKALDIIDQIIATIRASRTAEEAKGSLVGLFGFSELQAQAILDMRLQRLTGLERDKLLEEYREHHGLHRTDAGDPRFRLAAARGDQRRAGRDQGALRRQAAHRDHRGRRRHHPRGHDRRRRHGDHRHPLRLHQALAAHPLPLAGPRRQGPQRHGDQGRRLRRAPLRGLGAQLRPGLHRKRPGLLDQGAPPARRRAGRRRARRSSTCSSCPPTSGWPPPWRCAEFAGTATWSSSPNAAPSKRPSCAPSPTRGPAASSRISIDDGDRLLDVRATDGRARHLPRHHRRLFDPLPRRGPGQIAEAAARRRFGRGGRARTAEEGGGGRTLVGVRAMGRTAYGVRGILLRPDDRVIGMEALEKEGDLLTVTTNGYGKRTAIEEYRRQSRGGLGIINLKVSDKTGPVVGVKQVKPENGVMLITQNGKLIRISAGEVSRYGRSAQGVRVMDLDPGDRLVGARQGRRRRGGRSPGQADPTDPESRDRSDRSRPIRPIRPIPGPPKARTSPESED